MSALCDPPGAASPPRPPLSAQELAQEVKAFLSGVDPAQGTKLSLRDHARCALLLLRCLPPARHAALDHLRAVFDEQVCAHLLEREAGGGGGGAAGGAGGGAASSSGGLEEVVQEVQRVLGDFIRAKPHAWAPVVAAWSMELMGQLSSKYAGRHGVPTGTGGGTGSGLSELLQLWTSCRATRALLAIYTQCLSAMIGGCPDACVDALLDASVQHSPHFDWVVAHIGSSFPGTIISRVLSCGLKDFGAHGGGGSSPGEPLFPAPTPGGPADKRVAKLASVVGILGHLASRHAGSIKQELLRLFHESLNPPRGDPLPQTTVPFLLQLAVMSPALLGTVSAELVDSLQPAVLNQLHQHFAPLPREELDNLVAVAVHLVCQTSCGAYRLLRFLLDTAAPATVITPPGPAPHDGVREACDRLVQLLLLHLHKLVYNRGAPALSDPPPRPVPFLEALKGHVRELCVEALRLERKRCRWLHQLLALLAVYAPPPCATDALFYLLALARTQEELALATQLHAVLSTCLGDLLPATVATCVCQIHAGRLPEPQVAQLIRNLALVVQWEGGEGGAGAVGPRLGAVLSRHLQDLAQLLLHRHPEVAEAACLLLSVCPPPRAAPPAHLLAAVRAAVHQFFLVLRHRRGPAGLCYSGRLLGRLSAVSPAAAKAVLQQLVEGALRGGNAELFGGGGETGGDDDGGDGGGGGDLDGVGVGVSLLDTNRRFTANVTFAGGVWSVFHAGVIGRGLKPPAGPERRETEELNHNTHVFLSLLLQCCRGGGLPGDPPPSPAAPVTVNPEAAKAVAAALVESVCPEAAGAELPWPPEEQARGTLERDLRICRRFRRHPLLFPLLRLVAAGRPALCYCSVLLRGLLAGLLAHWDACRQPSAAASPWHLRASCALVALLAEGSLLPPVLGQVGELFPHLAPFEVHLLLLGVWGYLRDNAPLPQRFTFRPQRGVFLRDFAREGDVGKHLALLHSVIHKNIHRLGLLAARFRP